MHPPNLTNQALRKWKGLGLMDFLGKASKGAVPRKIDQNLVDSFMAVVRGITVLL
jgi:hypothetical protein